MRNKSFILVAFALALVTLADFSLAGETTVVKTPANDQAKKVKVKPAPFENYWAAQSWEVDGSVFWHAKEAPASTTPPKGTDSVSTARISAKK